MAKMQSDCQKKTAGTCDFVFLAGPAVSKGRFCHGQVFHSRD